ncbi:hypothetical protein GCM10011320_55420 [Neoroseomonas lacus]|uniref:Uncharacterized protein n=1 Tax=Neoroseomonas lacus TaxID=287609 RepID=A0A917L360_9PROT|nr:hypothetical protein GCM10011320_55420 [Neoroseomonas lacus]
MSQKKHKPEEIVAKLRQVDVLVSQGRSVSEAVSPEGAELIISALGAALRPIEASAPGRSIHGWIAAKPANAWTAFLTRGGWDRREIV